MKLRYFNILEDVDGICSRHMSLMLETVTPDGGKIDPDFIASVGDMTKKSVTKAKPILFSNSLLDEVRNEIFSKKEIILPDFPFQSFWIQSSDNSELFSVRGHTTQCSVFALSVLDLGNEYFSACFANVGDSGHFSLQPVLIGHDGIDRMVGSEKYFDSNYVLAINNFLSSVCKKMQEKNTYVGVENVNFRIRIGTGSSRQLHKVNQVLHITRGKEIKTYKNGIGNKIDWQHCWSVMGHWRNLSGTRIGKDRFGQYTQCGRTWVNPCVRGNISMPYLNKIRNFVGNNNQQFEGVQ